MSQPLEFDSFGSEPSEIRLISIFKCSAPGCNSEIQQEIIGRKFDVPSDPGEGWTRFGYANWLCPQHVLVVTIDGKEVYRTVKGKTKYPPQNKS